MINPGINNAEILIIGGGPAGLCAAKAAAELGAHVIICERDRFLGGQLVKQTHKFFGSEKQSAGKRGIWIGENLTKEIEENENIVVLKNAAVVGYYEDGVVGVMQNNTFIKIKPERTIIATGAAEKFLVFPGNSLPGVYGAGAVQTLMNVSGVKPANRVLMVGSGNIGLIVAYQLKQAGVEIAAVVEAAPQVGGFLVHASKIRRGGIPVLTRHTIVKAYGKDQVEGAVICELDEKGNPIPGTEQDIECDVICLAVGLTPLTEICAQAECNLKYIKELSGHVPIVDENLQTTTNGVYVAGDITGVEEASSAMVEGRLAGYAAAESLNYGLEKAPALKEEAREELRELRAGPMGLTILKGMEKLNAEGGHVHANLNRYSE